MTVYRLSRRMVRLTAAAVTGLGLTAGIVLSQPQAPHQAMNLPPNATALEGVPQVRIDVTQEGATRRELGAAEAARDHLTIRIVDGRLYWTTGEKRPLIVTSSRDFVYISSTEPGRYVRVRRLNDTLKYVEHTDMPFGSVTFWGELRIVLDK
jgi:hypothetical protein